MNYTKQTRADFLQKIYPVRFLNLHYHRITNDIALKPLPKMIYKLEVLELSMDKIRRLSPNGRLLQMLANGAKDTL